MNLVSSGREGPYDTRYPGRAPAAHGYQFLEDRDQNPHDKPLMWPFVPAPKREPFSDNLISSRIQLLIEILKLGHFPLPTVPDQELLPRPFA